MLRCALMISRGRVIVEDTEVRPCLKPEVIGQARMVMRGRKVLSGVGCHRQERLVDVGGRSTAMDTRPILILHDNHKDGLDRRGERCKRRQAWKKDDCR